MIDTSKAVAFLREMLVAAGADDEVMRAFDVALIAAGGIERIIELLELRDVPTVAEGPIEIVDADEAKIADGPQP